MICVLAPPWSSHALSSGSKPMYFWMRAFSEAKSTKMERMRRICFTYLNRLMSTLPKKDTMNPVYMMPREVLHASKTAVGLPTSRKQ